MATETTSSAEWDEKLGVWVGERAPSADMSGLPDPLYILGYGSLIWRPGVLLENLKTYKCTALGSMRLFAQRSCDHRGTPEFPGLVLNLVKDSVLEDLGYRTSSMSGSEFRGLVWHVPTSDVSAVIEDLDYRERGGYHRHIITVRLDKGPDGTSKVVDALVYTGAPSNPNFYLPPSSRTVRSASGAEPVNNEQSSNTITKEKTKAKRVDFFNLCKRNIMTDTIAAAVGPSGPNVDYLCNLEAFLNASDMHDPFLTDLATSVRLRLGIWRGRMYRGESSVDNVEGSQLTRELPFRLLGWGSNEFLQLSNSIDTTTTGQSEHENGLLSHRYAPTLISSSLPPALSTESLPRPPAQETSQPPTPLTVSSDSASEDDPLHLSGLETRFVVAGGGTSAVLHRGSVRLTGSLVPEVAVCIHTGQEAYVLPPTASGVAVSVTEREVLSQYNRSVVIDGIEGVAIGHHHLLLLHRRPITTPDNVATTTEESKQSYEDVIIALGSDSHGQCGSGRAVAAALGVTFLTAAELSLVPNPSSTGSYLVSTTSTSVTTSSTPGPLILKLAAGLRHSAVITTDGALLTWGDHRHGQCLSSTTPWRPPNGAKLVDVTCGAKFTVVLDNLGVVYQLGSPFGATASDKSGESGVPAEVKDLPKDVRWQRVTCGWSHVVLRGLSASMDRKLVFYAWGKQKLFQFVTDPSSESTVALDGSSKDAVARQAQASSAQAEKERAAALTPRPLASLPNGHAIVEVWCGSEFTLVADETGGVWGCGWNEHGNLGVGAPERKSEDSAVIHTWTRVRDCAPPSEGGSAGDCIESELTLSHVWEGALACGGAHVLCLP